VLGVVIATDSRCAEYARAAIISIRQHNRVVPIRVYLCGAVPYLEEAAERLCYTVWPVTLPEYLGDNCSADRKRYIWTRVTKLTAMLENPFNPCLYLDADTVALDDVSKVVDVGAGRLDDFEVYLLLRRPKIPSIYNWRRPYIVDSQDMTSEGMTALLNRVFDLDYTPGELLETQCWNGGVVYGTQKAVRLLAQRWLGYYERMVTGPHRDRFVPKDQLCLWLAAKQLARQIRVRELPLEWNCMAEHALLKGSRPDITLEEVLQRARASAKILHLGFVKESAWAVALKNALLRSLE
jgi:hypothetical protein